MIGILTPSISYKTSITVSASVEKAFSLFSDTSKMKDWTPGFVSISLDSGKPITQGSKMTLILIQEGQQYEMTETITTFIPHQQYSYLLENAVLHNQVDLFFISNGNSTIINVYNKVIGNNIIWRSVFFFYKKRLDEMNKEIYSNLKKMIESQP